MRNDCIVSRAAFSLYLFFSSNQCYNQEGTKTWCCSDIIRNLLLFATGTGQVEKQSVSAIWWCLTKTNKKILEQLLLHNRKNELIWDAYYNRTFVDRVQSILLLQLKSEIYLFSGSGLLSNKPFWLNLTLTKRISLMLLLLLRGKLYCLHK